MLVTSLIAVSMVFVCHVFTTSESGKHLTTDGVSMNCSPCSCHRRNTKIVADCFNLSLDEVPDYLPTSTSILNLTLNSITTITSTNFENFPDLMVLDLSNNTIDNINGAPFGNIPHLEILNLTGNNIDYLYEGTFYNLTKLTELKVSHCNISGINHGSLVTLQEIRILDLSGNQYLGLDGLENATAGLQNSNITTLLINKIIRPFELCVTVTEQHLQYLQNTSLETIEANDNSIESFEPSAISILPKTMKYVSVRHNRFAYAAYVEVVPSLTGLTDLDLGGHITTLHDLIPMVPIVNRATGRHYDGRRCDNFLLKQRNLPQADMRESKFAFFTYLKTNNTSRLPIPPNLKRVKYKYAESAFVIPEIHFGENKLEYVDMSYNVLAQWRGPIYGLNNLLYLDMSENVASYVSDDFFKDMTTLKFLNISGNSLDNCFVKDSEGKIFRHFPNLEILDLSRHYIPYLPHNVFQGLKSLTLLNISYNNIFNLELNLTHNMNLTFLNISYNQITWIHPYQRQQFDLLAKSHNFNIDLTGNPLHCYCNNIEFWEWLLNSDVILLNKEYYVCFSKHESRADANITNPKEFLENLKASCRIPDNFMLPIGISSLSVVIAFIILGSILYRFRWKLRYWFYAAKIRMKEASYPTQAFEFDAFVSYADENRFFVLNSLMPKLESKSLHLNIHHRDFIPGNAIAENIIDAIQRSRKTILILSRDFLKSKWCRYELHMANMESISTGRDVLLIVMLEDITNNVIPPEILYHIQNNTYIEYPQSVQDDSMFWDHLYQTLEH